jgi:mRNA-degrading endonuclease RelE of RelBE toxin-antitoxin system
MRVELAPQVVDFVRRLAPEPRRLVRRALRDLSEEKGDIRALEGPLDGYCRLAVHGYRIIFAYSGRGSIQCIFAERRSIVYEVFAEALAEELAGRKR